MSIEVVRLPIWGERIPGNTGESKSDIMKVDDSLTLEQIIATPKGFMDKNSDELADMVGVSTLAWRDEIRDGYAKETYSDVPFLIPYVVPGSKKCVIVCPGGGYIRKAMESEGHDMASFLNEAGISCFVLWYRSFPYKAPFMFLDCQRAVRYVRFHAAEYGIDPDKIATLGFSAGGNLCGIQALCFGDAKIDVEGYAPDEIDRTNGRPNAVGLCYPAVSLEADKALSCLAGIEVYNDKPQRIAFAAKYDLRTHVTEDAAPAFLCNCMDDDVLESMLLAELAGSYKEKDVDCELHMFPKGGHGFGACVEHPESFMKPDYSVVYQWKELFINWLNRVLA